MPKPKKSPKISVSDDKIASTIKALLESHFWLQTLVTMQTYQRLHDDDDGKGEGRLSVMFSPDGDARVWVEKEEGLPPRPVLRFRMPGQGGGRSHRTRVALLILAEAMRLDNEEVK